MQVLAKTTSVLVLGLAVMVCFVPVAQAESPPGTDVAELSHGYAILYQTVKKITELNKVLYVKLESDPLDNLDTALNKRAGKALDALDKYASSHPGLDLDDTGLPKVEQARRSNTTKTLLLDMATHSGVDFERLFLLANINVLNQSRHTAQALADLPQDESGKKLTQRLHKQFDEDYAKAVALLDKHYFCSSNSN